MFVINWPCILAGIRVELRPAELGAEFYWGGQWRLLTSRERYAQSSATPGQDSNEWDFRVNAT